MCYDCESLERERERVPSPSTLPRLMKCSGPKPDYLIDQQTIDSILWQFLLNDPTHSSHSTCAILHHLNGFCFSNFVFLLSFIFAMPSRKQTMHDFLQLNFHSSLRGKEPGALTQHFAMSAQASHTLYFFINKKTVREREGDMIT